MSFVARSSCPTQMLRTFKLPWNREASLSLLTSLILNRLNVRGFLVASSVSVLLLRLFHDLSLALSPWGSTTKALSPVLSLSLLSMIWADIWIVCV